MRAVDTNILVRLLTADDAGQLEAAEEFVRAGAWVSQVVLVEALWVLEAVYEVPYSRLVVAVEQLLDHEVLIVQEPEVVAAALATFRVSPKPGFSDCLILEIARKAGHLPLGTFDKALSKRPGALRLTPP